MCLDETRGAAEMSDATPHLAIAGACNSRSECNKFNNYHCILYDTRTNSIRKMRFLESLCDNVERAICRLVLPCIVRVHVKLI